MTKKDFNRVLEERIRETRRRLKVKGKEYGPVDRLHNFKRAAAVMRCSPERALVGFMMKHLISVLDIIDAIEKDPKVWISPDHWEEKLGDLDAYIHLLDGVFADRMQAKATEKNEITIPLGGSRGQA